MTVFKKTFVLGFITGVIFSYTGLLGFVAGMITGVVINYTHITHSHKNKIDFFKKFFNV